MACPEKSKNKYNVLSLALSRKNRIYVSYCNSTVESNIVCYRNGKLKYQPNGSNIGMFVIDEC
jgi:hypothetical protein